MAFYVLQTLTGKEHQIIKGLAKLHPQLSACLHWPRKVMKIRRRGKVFTREESIYPGYLFYQLPEGQDALDIRDCEILRRTSYVGRFLPSNQDPKPLSPDEEKLIYHLINSGVGDVAPLSRVSFDENQRIVVKEGPLKGLEGAIVKVDRRKQRVRVRLDLYAQGHMVDFSYEVVAPEED